MRKFLTQKAMSRVRHDVSVMNSIAKREKTKKTDHIIICGCGSEGCVILG